MNQTEPVPALDLEAIEGATPRPWTTNRDDEIVGADGKVVHSESDYGSGILFDDADLAFLIKAVNERDALIAEVRRLREQVKVDKRFIPYQAELGEDSD